jgi:hypothetical protein
MLLGRSRCNPTAAPFLDDSKPPVIRPSARLPTSTPPPLSLFPLASIMSVRSAVVQAPALARRALKPSAKASSSSTPSGRSYGSAAAAAGGGRRPLASCPPQQAARSGAASQKVRPPLLHGERTALGR